MSTHGHVSVSLVAFSLFLLLSVPSPVFSLSPCFSLPRLLNTIYLPFPLSSFILVVMIVTISVDFYQVHFLLPCNFSPSLHLTRLTLLSFHFFPFFLSSLSPFSPSFWYPQKRPHRRQFIIEDEDEDGYNDFPAHEWNDVTVNVILTSESADLLRFYRAIVSPFIESYWLGAKALRVLIGGRKMNFNSFFNYFSDSAKDHLRKGLLCYPESVSAETLVNCLNYFESTGTLKRKRENGIVTISLTQQADNENSIQQVIRSIEQFKK